MGIKLRVKLCEAGAVAHLLSLASFYLRVHRYLKKKKKKGLSSSPEIGAQNHLHLHLSGRDPTG